MAGPKSSYSTEPENRIRTSGIWRLGLDLDLNSTVIRLEPEDCGRGQPTSSQAGALGHTITVNRSQVALVTTWGLRGGRKELCG